MKRTQIYLEDSQERRLAKRAMAIGTTKSSVIREAIEAYLAGPADDATRLARFRAAVKHAAQNPVSLPEGQAYVEAIRAGDVARQAEIERRRG